MQRVLLLGASGFIGSHIARLLGPTGALVIAGPSSAGGDLTAASPQVWEELLLSARPDVIINAAGRTYGSAQQLSGANLLLVSRLLGTLSRLQLSPWLVHLGSAAEYGAATPDALLNHEAAAGEGQAVSEAWTCQPLSHYGVSKLAATRLLLGAIASGAARGVVLRVFNPVGAGQSAATLPGRAAALLKLAAEQQQPEVTFGALESRRDYIDVRDVARAAVFAAELGQLADAPPRILNVGSGQARCSREVVTGLAALAGFEGQLCETASGSARSALIDSQHADIGLFRALGWSPLYSFDDALQDLWHSVSPPAPVYAASASS
ncbi:NAD-dependent epimerase/dehydratase family protein [Deinococcus sp.]|uniref:NAD-dependent epimerase/dehydratase family protein n=1 Tax=Deinococcus sp. TaxID=47478 RepID=UPI003B59E3F8